MIYDIAILGYGPTGATLANLLSAQGACVLVLERETAMYHLPRAVHFDDEAMRVFQTVGIADDLVEQVHINPGMKFVDDDDNLLLDWPRPQEITSHGWHASYRLHQPDLEKLLRQKLATEPTVTIVTRFNVTSLEDLGDRVGLIGASADSGKEICYEARYLVGCDGANSLTRHTIGAEMEDFGFNERWLVVDLLLKRPRPDLGDHSVQFCNPDRPMTYCRSPGIRRRWEITVKSGESDVEVTTPDCVWQFLSRWITPEDANLERSAVYTFRSQVAKDWRKGRMLIAGDAAHLTPPFMGQGMCAGIRDAANLAWKLIACLNDSSDDLLDTYQDERAPHARAYVETAKNLGGLINSLDRQSALQMAQEQGDGVAQMRSIAPRLGTSTLMNKAQGAYVGRPFGQIDLGKGQRGFDDIIGYGHAIISPTRPTNMPANAYWLDPDQNASLASALDNLDAKVVWIRPDRYVGAVSDTGGDLLDALSAYIETGAQKQNETSFP